MSNQSRSDPLRKNAAEAKVRERREFLRSSAAALAGLTLGPALATPARAQIPVAKQNLQLNATAKSLMPDGKLLGRMELLAKLNLDPSTPPDAWLAIFRCGSNAGALGLRDINILMKRGILKEDMLLEHQLKQIRR